MKPANEAERLKALASYDILDTEAEQAFDDLTSLAARMIDVPTALVSLVDADRQWFKSRVGLDVCETPRDIAFCSRAILTPDQPLIVLDATKDARFANNPLVTGEPGVRFYAGIPLVTPEHLALGTLCVIDYEPRELREDELEMLRALARHVQSQLELRKTCATLQQLTGELKHANEDLVRKHEEIRTFYHAVSHELKTPLTSAREFVSIVLDEIAGTVNDEQRDYLETARGGMDKIVYYVHDLLDSTRLETGKMTLNRDLIPAKELIEECCRIMMPRARAKGIELSHDAANEDIVLYVDSQRASQVLTNLVGNALKFTPDGGHIHVSMHPLSSEDGFATFSVKDSGCGIPQEHHARIFERLYQVEGSESQGCGLGLGLNICRGVVELHGGTISVESTAGKGCEFRFTLPIGERAMALDSPS